jgi:diaminohydroxyphosphoribosylaminopyrimidine deaminase / 5-amino-6-(5-phosphoribosylamino)uracil reductase
MLMSNETEKLYIRRSFELAHLGSQKTSPNPQVGSVIVYKDEIIGEGWHQYYGGAHAEVNAVNSVEPYKRHLIPESTIYVSLEPCFHFGKTPPCVELILKERIKKVIIAYKDPNPKVAGQSIEKLRLNGVDVIVYNLNPIDKYNAEKKTINVAQPFFTNILQQRPYIILKWAESKDGFIGIKNERTPISNDLSNRLVHKWRSECDGILVGTNTAETDNPHLDNRFYFGKSPVRLVIDRTQRLHSNLNIFDNVQKTLIFSENTEGDNLSLKEGDNIENVQLNFNGNWFETMMSELLKRKIGIVLVEGGTHLINSFIEHGLWDEARVIKSFHVLLKPEISSYSSESCLRAPKISEFYKINDLLLDDNAVTFYRKP